MPDTPQTPDAILSFARAFMGSRVFLTAVELDVFTPLSKEPLTAAEIATMREADPRGVAILLDALVPMGFLAKEDGRYRCPEEPAAFLSADSPRSLVPMLRLSVGGWMRWSKLTDIVRHGNPNAKPTFYDETSGEQALFIRAMHVVAYRLAPAIVAAAGTGSAKQLLDIGGASGSYTQAFLEASPEMTATLFDLPPVIAIAQKQLAGTAIANRVSYVAGDFYQDELPAGHDMALLSAIIHQNSSAQNVELYEKVSRALVSGGRLLVRDHVMSSDHTQPPSGTMFAVNMLVGTEGGRTYSFEEIKAELEAAGFERVNLIQPDTRMDGLVEAFKP